MNLNQIIAPITAAVNPLLSVGVQSNVGNTEAADGTQTPIYATPGSITASIGASFTASIPDPTNPTTMVVASVASGTIQPNDVLSGSDGINSLPFGCYVVEQLSGPAGGAGDYQISTGTASGTLESCTVTDASTVLAVSGVGQGVLQAGQTLADSGALAVGTLITGQLSGTAGGTGLYSVSQQQTVALETMTTSMTLSAQVQPLTATDLRHVDMLNLQGSHRAFYFNAAIRGGVRVALKGGDLLTLPDGSIWLVNQPVEQWSETAGWVHVIGTLQDGS